MKKVVTVVLLVAASRVWALDPLGPTVPKNDRGEWSAGAEYSYSRELWGFEGFPDLSFGKAKISKVFANISYGISENWDVFLRAGANQTDASEVLPNEVLPDNLLRSGDWQPAFGVGSRVALCRNEWLDWGLLAQFGWQSIDLDEQRMVYEDYGYPLVLLASGRGSAFNFQVATGPNLRLSDNLHVYGGPFLCYRGVDLETTLGAIDFNGDSYSQVQGAHFQEWGGGAYGGIRVDIGRLGIFAEYQRLFNEAEGYAGGLVWRF